MSPLRWFVAHTRARREKKIKEHCERSGVPVTLPLYRTVHKYRGKTVTFEKPLFPCYVFIQLPEQKKAVFHTDHISNLLVVHDQELFMRQLGEILEALRSDLQIFLAPEIGHGSRVKVKFGPLRGMDGWVEERYGLTTVLLRLDFIGQAAA